VDVIGFGALNVDRIYSVERIPGKDEEVFVKELQKHPGGSAANTLAGLARLGMETGALGIIGDDADGLFILEDLKKEGVDIHGIIRRTIGAFSRTGKAFILSDAEGNRAIIIDPGANDTISYEEIDIEYIKKSRLLHITSFACKNGENSFLTQKKLVKEISITVSFDPGNLYAHKGLNALKDIIEKTEVFMPNNKELKILTGKDYVRGAEEIISLGADIVVVKLGGKGCYITNGKSSVEIPPFHVKVVDTTGAGDAFNAGFLYAYLNGMDLEYCGKLGNLIAAHCVQKTGARMGLPFHNQIDLI